MSKIMLFVGLILWSCKPSSSNLEESTEESVKSKIHVSSTAPSSLPSLRTRSTRGKSNGYLTRPLGLEVTWRKNPLKLAKPEKSQFTHFVIHHSAFVWAPPSSGSPEAWSKLCQTEFDKVLKFQTAGKEKQFEDLAYHFLICPTGQVFEGRVGKNIVGASSFGQNQGTLGILLMGQYSPEVSDVENYGVNKVLPAGQSESLARLLAWLSVETKIDLNAKKKDSLYNVFPLDQIVEKKINFSGRVDFADANLAGKRIVASSEPIPHLTYHGQIGAKVPAKLCIGKNCGGYVDACPGKTVVDKLPEILSRAEDIKRNFY